MNVMKNIIAVGVLSFLFLTGTSSAADVTKIGVVDFRKIVEVSNPGKAAQAEIEKQGKQMETDIKDRGKAIEDIEKKIEQESLVMSKEAREEKQRELRIKIGDFKSLQRKYMEDFKALEMQTIGRIQKEVIALVEDIGKKEGYTMIVEKRTGGVVYMPLSIDITDTVIQIYNTKNLKSESNKTFESFRTSAFRLAF